MNEKDYLMPNPLDTHTLNINQVVRCSKHVETQFLPGNGRGYTAVWLHHLDANKTDGEEARRQLHQNVASNIEKVLAATPCKAPTIRPPTSHHVKLS